MMDRFFAVLIVVASVLCFSSAQQGFERCIFSRLDFVECQYNNPNLIRAKADEFSVHHTLLRQGQSGFVECLVRRRDQFVSRITDLGTKEMRIIYSSGFTIGEEYDDQLLMEYNVACEEGEFAFFNVTNIDIEGNENCRDPSGHPRCQDYILIDRGSFGTTELCGNATTEIELGNLENGKFKIFFRSSETTRKPGFRMFVVCYKQEERDRKGCFSADEFNSSVCADGVSGSGMDGIEPMGDSRRRRDTGSDMLTDVFDSYGLRMRKDLVEFHMKWQRRRRQVSDIRFEERNIFYNETVRFEDRTLIVRDSDGEETGRFEDIYILETFDEEGTQRAFFQEDDGVPTPGPGPLFIVGRVAYFQLFAIDPRGIIPDEEEAMELQRMNEVMLDSVPAANDPNVTDPDQTIEPLGIPGLIENRRRRQIDETVTEVDEGAVFAALRNREACNPVLRAQSRATLTFFRGINSSLVDALETFPMTCSVVNNQLSCVTESITIPNRTLCKIDNMEEFVCDTALKAPLDLDLFVGDQTSFALTVTSVNCNGQSARVELDV